MYVYIYIHKIYNIYLKEMSLTRDRFLISPPRMCLSGATA